MISPLKLSCFAAPLALGACGFGDLAVERASTQRSDPKTIACADPPSLSIESHEQGEVITGETIVVSGYCNVVGPQTATVKLRGPENGQLVVSDPIPCQSSVVTSGPCSWWISTFESAPLPLDALEPGDLKIKLLQPKYYTLSGSPPSPYHKHIIDVQLACANGSTSDWDLDGSIDCDSPDEEQIYPTESTLAGAAAHVETKLRDAVLTTSWDGRLVFSSQLEDPNAPPGERDYIYRVAAFRPEAAPEDSDGFLQLNGANALSPFKVLTSNYNTPNRLHITIYPDPDPNYPPSPYPSGAGGAPIANGAFATYRFYLIGKSEVAGRPNAESLPFLTQVKGRITVANPGKPYASITDARLIGDAVDLRTVTDGYIWGYEPTSSFDGRLVVLSGRPHELRDTIGASVYSFNPDPAGNPNGWTDPRSIADMYWVHGPGAASETDVDGIPFSERYPIAAKPLRDPEGRVFQLGEWMPGAYPWLSFDATELFFQVERNFFGSTRTGVSAVGVRTNWILQHLDGPINPTRATTSSDGRINHFLATPEGKQLKDAYTNLTRVDGSPLGNRGYERVLVSGLALSQSMWNPMRDAPTTWWPRLPGSDVYSFGLSANRRLVEVQLDDVVDGHVLVSLPMNELLTYDHEVITTFYDGAGGEPGNWDGFDLWDLRRDLVAYSPTRTQDVSGNLHTGTLNSGAAFPYEYFGVQERWADFWAQRQSNPKHAMPADVVDGDRNYGIVGQAVFFQPSGAVTSRLSSSARSRLRNAGAFTAELWFKRLVNTSIPYSLAYQSGLYSVSLDAMGRVGTSLSPSSPTAAHTISAGASAPVGQWQHVAVVHDGDSLLLYVDGVLANSAHAPGFSQASASWNITIGPGATGSGDAILLIDEYRLSDVARTPQEVRESALIRTRPFVTGSTPALPTGMENAAIYIPTNSPYSAAVRNLGEQLFFDHLLSVDGTMRCSTCHIENLQFTDGQQVATGRLGAPMARNTPSLFNRLTAAAQFYDGRESSLETQVAAVFAHPREFGWSLTEAAEVLNSHPTYPTDFEVAFGSSASDGITAVHIQRALATYLRSLTSGNSRVDQKELSESEMAGQGLFLGKARCGMCHHGPNYSDEQFHDIGSGTSSDQGRGEITGRAVDMGRFRTQSLRDIAETAPYFHDGRFATLRQVIDFYNSGGGGNASDVAIQPLNLTSDEKNELEDFLEALSGR